MSQLIAILRDPMVHEPIIIAFCYGIACMIYCNRLLNDEYHR